MIRGRTTVSVAAIGAVVCLFASPSVDASSTSSTSAGRNGPVVIVGVDGLTFDVVDPLVAAGRMPNVATLLDRGARAVMASERPMRSPALWTTIATGRERADHGIYDFVTGTRYWPAGQRGGKQRLVTSGMRKVPAIWQLAGDAGLRSLVVGWLNTWPAEKIRGAMVAPYVALGQRRQTSIKGKIYGDAARQTYPPETFERIRPLVVDADQVNPQRVAALIDEPPPGSPLYRKVPRLRRYLYTVRWSIASTLTNTAIVENHLRQRHDTDLVMTYFDGADTLAHRFWIMRESIATIQARLKAEGLDPTMAPELKRRLGGAVDGYYVLLDEMIGRIVKAAGPDATIMLVSDHGWGSSGRVKAPHDTVPFDGEHRLDGVFIAAGPNIVHGRFKRLTLYDVAPTALYMMGVGVPEELRGRVALDVIDDAFVAFASNVNNVNENRPLLLAEKRAAAIVPRHPIADDGGGETPFEETEIERLRSLGYVQ